MIPLRVTIERIAEHRCEAQAGIDCIGRLDAYIEVRILRLVLVVTVAVLQDSHRVGKTIVWSELAIDVIVVAEQAGKSANDGIVLVWTYDRSLDEREECW